MGTRRQCISISVFKTMRQYCVRRCAYCLPITLNNSQSHWIILITQLEKHSSSYITHSTMSIIIKKQTQVYNATIAGLTILRKNHLWWKSFCRPIDRYLDVCFTMPYFDQNHYNTSFHVSTESPTLVNIGIFIANFSESLPDTVDKPSCLRNIFWQSFMNQRETGTLSCSICDCVCPFVTHYPLITHPIISYITASNVQVHSTMIDLISVSLFLSSLLEKN